MTYIEEYYNKIVSGEIVACKRIKQVYKKLVDDIHNPKDNWIFDPRYDQIINILPQQFFINCAIVIASIMFLCCLFFIYKEYKDNYKTKK